MTHSLATEAGNCQHDDHLPLAVVTSRAHFGDVLSSDAHTCSGQPVRPFPGFFSSVMLEVLLESSDS